ncbi:MAG: tRNA dihydrouridine synthase DusB [Myxococcota bacterium]
MSIFPLEPLKIGKITLDPPLIMAPLANVSIPATRIMAEKFGAQLTFTEMVPAAGVFRGIDRAIRLIAPSSKNKPWGVQIFGNDPHEIEFTANYLAGMKVDLIDINMGCPMRDIVRNGSGAAMMKTPELAAKLVEAACMGVKNKIPITAKIRSGWDEKSINAHEMASLLEKAGCKMITVHGRTRSQIYSGKSDPHIIAKVAKTVDIPVIANGDIFDPGSAENILQITRAKGIMIARGSFGNPWIFRDLKSLLQGKTLPPPPEPLQKLTVMKIHLKMLKKGNIHPKRKLTEIKKHLAWFSKKLTGSNKFRKKIFATSDLESIERMIKNFEKQFSSS